jgi:hypothetical protein
VAGRAGSVGTVILRPTAKAARLLRVTPAAGIEPGEHDWYLNVLWIDGRKHALLAHARTAFPILVPDIRVAHLRPLGRWLADTISAALAEEDLPADTLGPLDNDEPTIAKTASRQLLGFMTETAFRADIEISHAGGLPAADIAEVNRHLRHDLHNYDGRYATPLELITGRRR